MFSVRGLIGDAHEAAITAVAYSPHRREFYTAGADNLVKCWETESGAFVRSLAGHKGWVTDLLYIPSLRQLVSSSIDGKLLCWGLKAGSTQSKNEKIDFHSLCEDQPGGDLGTPIHCMAYCERRRMLVTATDGTINMYTVKVENRKMKLEFISKVRQHTDLIRILLIIDDRQVLSAGYDRKIGVFDLDSEVRSYIAKPADGGHDGAIAAMTFDTLNNRVITGGYDRRIKVWSTDGRLLQNFEDFATSVTGLCYCEVTRHLWACCSCGRPYVYDLHSGSNITEIVHTGVDGLRSPSMLKRGYCEGTKDVIATTANREVIYWRYNPTAALRVLHGHSNWVEVLAVSNPPAPEIPELFSAGMDKKVKKWELGTKFNPDAIYCNDEYVGHSATILCAVFSDEHSLLVTGSEDMSIRVWQYATEKKRLDLDTVELFELTEHEERVTGLTCRDHILISVSWDQTVRFWDLHTGTYQEAWTIEDAHDDYIYDVEYVGRANDGMMVDQFATCSADRTIKIWDFSTLEVKGRAELVHTLSGHAGEVYKLTWNRMHSLWVSGAEDSTIRTWSLEGDPVATIHARDAVTALCTDNETGYCVAASLDLAIRVYDLVAQEVSKAESKTAQPSAAFWCFNQSCRLGLVLSACCLCVLCFAWLPCA
jgi:WD40 repeat protein